VNKFNWLALKMARLKQWCEDINRVQDDVKFGFVYVDRSVTKLVGKDNPAYKHGKETNKARTERRERVKELQDLENAGRKLGMIVGPKTRGRKIK
jgi:hypothetical protein